MCVGKEAFQEKGLQTVEKLYDIWSMTAQTDDFDVVHAQGSRMMKFKNATFFRRYAELVCFVR